MRTSDDSAISASPHRADDVWYGIVADSRETPDGPSDRMLAELCHDLRQPLTTLKMNLQAIVRLLQRPRPRVAAALDAVADCLDAEQDVVELLAGMSGGTTLAMAVTSRVALNSIATDVQAMLSQARPDLGRRVELCLADRSPTVNGDASRLRFAVLSLVRYALEYGGNERPQRRVVIGTQQADAHAELSVSGLPLPMVLGPSLHTTLTVTHGVVRSHRGIATIEPQPAGGTVRIMLPRELDD